MMTSIDKIPCVCGHIAADHYVKIVEEFVCIPYCLCEIFERMSGTQYLEKIYNDKQV